MNSRFDRIEPIKQTVNESSTNRGSNRACLRDSCNALSEQHSAANDPAAPNHSCSSESKDAHSRGSQRRFSSKSKPTVYSDTDIRSGSEGHEKPIDLIKVSSERESTKEFEKIISSLRSEQDWTIRMAAMQTFERMIVGGAAEYPSFLPLFKHFVGPLSAQVSDRRSSIVKQACQLLKILSKQFQRDFELFAEAFISALFKSVAVTVLVIAESADNCVKTILKNCCVARALPRFLECATRDLNPVMRIRSCEYALLVLDRWGDSPEIHRSTDLFQELILCCSLDAVAEVRSTTSACYRVFSRLWPDRARWVFSVLDPAFQKVLLEELEELVRSRCMFPPFLIDGGYQNLLLLQSNEISPHLRQASGGESLHERCKMGGSYREIHAPSSFGTTNVTIEPPCDRDPPYLASAPTSCRNNLSGHSNFTGLSEIVQPYSSFETSKGEECEDNSKEVRSGDLNATEAIQNHQSGGFNVKGETSSYMDGVMSFNDTLSEGLGPDADWSARVTAFVYIQKLLQQGSNGLQEVIQNFESIMKLFSGHLNDPHWKVTQAALSALIELVPTCRRMFESYLERILSSVFARLVDTKVIIRQLGLSVLEAIGNTYGVDTLLLPLLRSIDEQRKPKARMAAIEFTTSAFAKLAMQGPGTAPTGLLKLWLSKLAQLTNDKNTKLGEAAIAGIISAYSNFDTTIVLNFILGLAIEEQNMLRRALKQFTPHIELDVVSYLQNKTQRLRIKSALDQTDAALDTSEDTGRALSELSSTNPEIENHSTLSHLEGCCKRNFNQAGRMFVHCLGRRAPSSDDLKYLTSFLDLESAGDDREPLDCDGTKEIFNGVSGGPNTPVLWSDQAQFKDGYMSSGNFGYKASNILNSQLRAGMTLKSDSKRSNEMPAVGYKTYTEAYLQRVEGWNK